MNKQNMPSAEVIPGLMDSKILDQVIEHAGLGAFLTIDIIIDTCAKEWGVLPSEMKSKTRLRNPKEARHASMYFIKDILKLPLSACGKPFNRKHCTVLHAIRAIRGLYDSEKKTFDKFTNIERKLNLYRIQ